MRGFTEDVNTRDDESFLFKKIEYFRIQGKENSPTCHKLTKAINERDRVWTNANLLSDVWTALVVVVA